jgi:glycosyltransferase involved in cell wall biosynthesis
VQLSSASGYDVPPRDIVQEFLGRTDCVRQLRVAHVAPYDPDGGNGVSRAVLNWARLLPKFNIEIEIWDFSNSVSAVVDSSSDSCRVFLLPARRNSLLNMVSLPEVTRRFLAKRVKCINALHLHSVFRPENHWAARLGLPFVVSPHNGYNSELLKARSRFRKLVAGLIWERADLNRARRILALNASEHHDLLQYGVKADIMQLPNILDPAILSQTEATPPPGDLWVYLGRLDVQVKGLDALLAGFAKFRALHPSSINRLVLAGPTVRGGLAQLRRLTEKLGLSDWVDFPGPRFDREKVDLLNRTAVFLHPSRAEGVPYAVLEALTYSRPVLVTASTNLAEVVEAYDAGWVVEPTGNSIAHALECIQATTTDALNAKGRSARELIRREFASPDPVAGRLASVYREISK